jgi:hypothetical protein
MKLCSRLHWTIEYLEVFAYEKSGLAAEFEAALAKFGG